MSDTEELCARLQTLPVAVVSDVLAAMGLGNRVLTSAIHAIGSAATVAGHALCLGGVSADRALFATVNRSTVYETDRHITPGCIAVVATQNSCAGAVIGGNVALSWKVRGCRAVVTDSGIRDVAEFASLQLPAFASFVTPMSNKGLWSFATIDEPVMLPGQLGDTVPVVSGDIVHADADGVVIIPRLHAAQAVHDAELYEAAEARVRAELERGDDREAVYKRHDKTGHIKRVTR